MRKDSEELTKQILSGLRDADVPEGMRRRILIAVEERAAGASASPLSRFRSFGSPRRIVAWSVGLAGLMASCLIFSLLHQIEHSDQPEAMRAAFVAQKPPRVAALQRPHLQPALKTKAHVVHPTSTVPPTMVPVSFPAPPLPLTEQEKLLLRLAHKGDPVELAMLDPMQRATRNANERADFEKFFEQSTTGGIK